MAVDITLLFRASVKTVKTRNKALGVAVGGGADGSRDELFRRSPRPKGDFSSRAREVVSWLLWERQAGDRGGSAPRTLDPKLGPASLALGEERESLARQKRLSPGANSWLGVATGLFSRRGTHIRALKETSFEELLGYY